MRTLTVLGIGTTLSHVNGFLGVSPSLSQTPSFFFLSQHQSQSSFQEEVKRGKKTALHATTTPTTNRASLVSVCTAELCCCQEDGIWGGQEILNDLLSRNLPYPVDAAPCLGACGGGAMVAIDFEDGSSALVSGIDETLMELGLLFPDQSKTTPIAIPTIIEPIPEDSATIVSVIENVAVEAAATTTATVELSEDSRRIEQLQETNGPSLEVSIPVEEDMKIVINSKKVKTVKPSVQLVDVRERMRLEAAAKAKTEQPSNPWLNAASYLAGKAAEKFFGDK